jgi:hypothetical protein
VRRASSTPLPASSQRLWPLRRWRTQSSAMRCLCLSFNCTNAYTFAFEKWRMSVVYQNNGQHAHFGGLISAVNMCSLVQLKIPFRKECRFEPDHPHQLIRHDPFTPLHGGRIMPERGFAARRGGTPRQRNDNRTALSCWPMESRTGFGHRQHRLRVATIFDVLIGANRNLGLMFENSELGHDKS